MPEPARDHQICFIRSTVDVGKAACLMEWGPIQALLQPDVVLTTARELMAAAVAAETDIALVETFREEISITRDSALATILGAVRRRRPAPTGAVALRIAAVAGATTGKPFVHIARGSMAGSLSPDEARAMAMHWTQTAVAAQIDVRLRYALGEWDHLLPADIERLFALVQEVQR